MPKLGEKRADVFLKYKAGTRKIVNQAREHTIDGSPWRIDDLQEGHKVLVLHVVESDFVLLTVVEVAVEQRLEIVAASRKYLN